MPTSKTLATSPSNQSWGSHMGSPFCPLPRDSPMTPKLKPVTVRMTPEQLVMLESWWKTHRANQHHETTPSHAKILKEILRRQIKGFSP